MKWGSLDSVLHERTSGGRGLRIKWAARKKIAIGSARGLASLHHSCIPHVIHHDLKSSNVLLYEYIEARVSDFGRARLVNASTLILVLVPLQVLQVMCLKSITRVLGAQSTVMELYY